MKFKKFKELIKTHQQYSEWMGELSDMGIDFINNDKFPLLIKVNRLFYLAINESYSKTGWDWVEWFVYENEYGTNGLTASCNEEPICFDIKSLHTYIKRYKNNEFKPK